MTSSKPAPKPYILELSFDADQVTQSLQFRVISPVGDDSPLKTKGPMAGTFNFVHDDEITVRVVATAEAAKPSDPMPTLDVNVTNCTFVSIGPDQKQFLSLFDPYNACTMISEWSLPEVVENKSDNSVTVTVNALKTLKVVAHNGQWKISGYLSVLIGRGKDQLSHLYFFDPEGSAGGGAGQDPP